jgi:hypothetical protein
MTSLFSASMVSPLASAHPAAAVSALAPLDGRSGSGLASAGASVLRAEVEPDARGLSVQAHADRVLNALLAGPAERA